MDKKRRDKLKPKHRAFIQRVKLRKGCQQCGYRKYTGALHFHHIEPKGTGGKAVQAQWSMTKIKNEIRKCEVLCANCHAERHSNE